LCIVLLLLLLLTRAIFTVRALAATSATVERVWIGYLVTKELSTADGLLKAHGAQARERHGQSDVRILTDLEYFGST